MSLEIFKQSLSTYQSLVKDEKNKFLSDVIARNQHKPKILFNTINSVINPPENGLIKESLDLCESFFNFFL